MLTATCGQGKAESALYACTQAHKVCILLLIWHACIHLHTLPTQGVGAIRVHASAQGKQENTLIRGGVILYILCKVGAIRVHASAHGKQENTLIRGGVILYILCKVGAIRVHASAQGKQENTLIRGGVINSILKNLLSGVTCHRLCTRTGQVN
jgi:hypothetical protein